MEKSRELSPPFAAVTSGQAHTPGPWTADDVGGYRWCSVWAGQRLIAEVGSAFSSNDLAKADARLIAAAPELLEALQKADGLFALGIGSVARYFPENSERCIAEARAILAQIRAAIAKASSAEPAVDAGPGMPS